MAPHDCVECGEPCYIPFGLSPLCTNRSCQHYDEDTWVSHVLLIPDEEVGEEFEIEDDEDTLPGLYGRFPRVSSWLPAPKDLGPKSAAKQATVPDGGWLKMPTLKDLDND